CALSLWACMGLAPRCALAQASKGEVCPRPPAGSAVPEPEDLRSQNGVLRVELTFLNFRDPRGQARYCYLYKDGSQAPTLRLHPGDRLILTLKNDLKDSPNSLRGPAAQ